MRPRSAARPLLLGLLLAALAAPGGAGAELWRWIDADGVARYTPDPDRVPAARRSTLTRVEPGMASAPSPKPAVAKPLPIFAPPGDAALEQDPWNAPGRAPAVEGEILRDSRELVVEVPTTPPPGPSRDSRELVVEVPTAPPPSPPSAAPPAPAPPLSRDAEERRAELVAAIARDEEALKEHVSSAQDSSIVTNPELREIAERLPALQAELRALEARSAAP
jgi:hypothetical protein